MSIKRRKRNFAAGNRYAARRVLEKRFFFLWVKSKNENKSVLSAATAAAAIHSPSSSFRMIVRWGKGNTIHHSRRGWSAGRRPSPPGRHPWPSPLVIRRSVQLMWVRAYACAARLLAFVRIQSIIWKRKLFRKGSLVKG